jgi:hypothetical protein
LGDRRKTGLKEYERRVKEHGLRTTNRLIREDAVIRTLLVDAIVRHKFKQGGLEAVVKWVVESELFKN